MRSLATAFAVVCTLTVVTTWPQALHLSTKVAGSVDSYFSMWRLAWIAHALATEPEALFDANIFYPTGRTLALSDATLLQGVLAAPLLWANVPLVLVYNLLLLGGIAASGVGMFVLARHLTRSTASALVAATVFSMGPYRVSHYMHLELQWAMWIPLTFWALHRAVDEGSWRFGALAGVFLWLQVLSCVYFGVFLVTILVIFVPLLFIGTSSRQAARAGPGLLLGGLIAGVLTMPYAAQYLAAARAVGRRAHTEIATYSAQPINYLAGSEANWLWGWTAAKWGGAELNLFPGAVAIALAVAAAWHRPRWLAFVYAVVAVGAIELSFGVNSHVYAWLLDQLDLLQGLRAPSRFGIVALCAVAMLAGFGMQVLLRRLSGERKWLSAVATGLVLAVMITEYLNTGMNLTDIAPDHSEPRSVYTALRSLGRGVVLELPLPRMDALPGQDPWYAYWSRAHWYPIVNGYSGYYPPTYIETIARTRAFPDDRSIAHLRGLGVRYVIVHRSYYTGAELVSLVEQMVRRPELEHLGTLQAPSGPVELFMMVSRADDLAR